jgi:hypothetical protein
MRSPKHQESYQTLETSSQNLRYIIFIIISSGYPPIAQTGLDWLGQGSVKVNILPCAWSIWKEERTITNAIPRVWRSSFTTGRRTVNGGANPIRLLVAEAHKSFCKIPTLLQPTTKFLQTRKFLLSKRLSTSLHGRKSFKSSFLLSEASLLRSSRMPHALTHRSDLFHFLS